MTANRKKGIIGIVSGAVLLLIFVVWTILVQRVDVQIAGESQTEVGFATLNVRFHELTGVKWNFYSITDWFGLGLIPVLICGCFGIFGILQLIRRKSLKKVDRDIVLLGIYYIAVIAVYLLFEKVTINKRPVLIEGVAEESYPSTTTLVVLTVMLSLIFQVSRRVKNTAVRNAIITVSALYAAFMVVGRTISGVHWLTDIIGAVILSAGMYLVYRGAAVIGDQ